MGLGGRGSQGYIVIRWTPSDAPSPGAGNTTWVAEAGPISSLVARSAPVIVSNGGGSTGSQAVTSPGTEVTTVLATGTKPLVYSLNGGADVAKFAIDANSGDMDFISPSVNGNYTVGVKVTNDLGNDTQTLTVNVASASTVSGVHFDGSTWLEILSLTQTNVPNFAMFFWFRLTGTTTNQNVFGSQGNDTYMKIGGNGISAQYDTVLSNLAGDGVESSDFINPYDSNWHWALIGGNTNFDFTTGKKLKVYVDGVDKSNITSDSNGAVNVELSGRNFWIGQDSFGVGWTGDLAQFWYANVNILDGSFDIPIGTRNQFVLAGHAQPSSGFPAGAVILLDGNASGFATNQGTGGATVTTGTLTNSASNPP